VTAAGAGGVAGPGRDGRVVAQAASSSAAHSGSSRRMLKAESPPGHGRAAMIFACASLPGMRCGYHAGAEFAGVAKHR